MLGINPAMIAFLVKSKLDEIINGQLPDGLFLKDKTETKILLGIKENVISDNEVNFNFVHASITYKNIEIILEHGTN